MILSVSERLADGDLVKLMQDTFGSAMPFVFFVGVVASLVLMAIYINSRSLVLTAVTAMLSGAVVVEYMPPQVRMAGYGLILLAAAAVGASIYTGRQRPVR